MEIKKILKTLKVGEPMGKISPSGWFKLVFITLSILGPRGETEY